MSDPQTELTHVISEGGIAAKHPLTPEVAALVGSATGSEHNTVRAGVIPVACWRLEDVRFEFDSSFVVPGIEAELKTLAQLVKDHPPASKSEGKPGFPLSVFGHADPTGNDDYNKQLSGRRATAIYALLTRDTNLWEKLFSQPFGNDKWGRKSLETMLDKVSPAPAGKSNQEQAIQHERDAGKRKELFGRYMENLCGPELKLKKQDFLAHGDDTGGKGDFQGCSEFNPVLIFSQKDQTRFEQNNEKTLRNDANAPNRRVMVLILRKGSRVDPSKWPCPRVTEGTAGCRKRF
jgi:OmpA family